MREDIYEEGAHKLWLVILIPFLPNKRKEQITLPKKKRDNMFNFLSLAFRTQLLQIGWMRIDLTSVTLVSRLKGLTYDPISGTSVGPAPTVAWCFCQSVSIVFQLAGFPSGVTRIVSPASKFHWVDHFWWQTSCSNVLCTGWMMREEQCCLSPGGIVTRGNNQSKISPQLSVCWMTI